MDYLTLKVLHVSAVIVSFCGFVARGIGVLRGAPWVRHRATRRVADERLSGGLTGLPSSVDHCPEAFPPDGGPARGGGRLGLYYLGVDNSR